MEGLDAAGSDGAQAAGDLDVHGFKGVAEKFAEVTDAVKGESDDAGQGVGTDDGDADERPDEAGHGADAVEGHAGAADHPAGGERAGAGDAERDGDDDGEGGGHDGDLRGLGE